MIDKIRADKSTDPVDHVHPVKTPHPRAPGLAVTDRRRFLAALGAMATFDGRSPRSAQPVTLSGISDMKLIVSDLKRSVVWYQRLFGMTLVSRRNRTATLRVGNGPASVTLEETQDQKPGIVQMGFAVPRFDARDVLSTINERGVPTSDAAGPHTVRTEHARVKDREESVVVVQDHDGLALKLGNASTAPEQNTSQAQPNAVLRAEGYNHFTSFVLDGGRAVAFYRQLFRLPIDTYQGAMPLLRIGEGNQFLAFVTAGGRDGFQPFIHHACLTVKQFDPKRVLRALADFGIVQRKSTRGPIKPLQSYVTMRMPDRGGAPGGTPELYFSDPDGILLQLQDVRYSGGSGYLGDQRGQRPPKEQ